MDVTAIDGLPNFFLALIFNFWIFFAVAYCFLKIAALDV